MRLLDRGLCKSRWGYSFVLLLSILSISTKTFAQPVAPTFNITQNQNSSVCQGSPISFSVSSTDDPSPTGKIFIVEGATQHASADLASGAATVSISTLSPGLHTLSIFYEGDGAYNPYTSPTYNYTVNAPPTIIVNSTAPTICFGTSSTLTVTGAANYSWSPATIKCY